jgi:hypothetical protein
MITADVWRSRILVRLGGPLRTEAPAREVFSDSVILFKLRVPKVAASRGVWGSEVGIFTSMQRTTACGKCPLQVCGSGHGAKEVYGLVYALTTATAVSGHQRIDKYSRCVSGRRCCEQCCE